MPIIIKNFSKHYETSDNKKVKEMKWLALPIKFDGLKYRRLMKIPSGLEILGTWIILLQLSAKMPVRGTLATHDGDLTLDDISLMTDCPLKSLKKAISVLSSKEIGWVQNSSDNLPTISEDSRTTLQDTTGQDKTEQDNLGERFPFLFNALFLSDWESYVKSRKGKMTDRAKELALMQLHKHSINTAISMLQESIKNGWKGLFEPKGQTNGYKTAAEKQRDAYREAAKCPEPKYE